MKRVLGFLVLAAVAIGIAYGIASIPGTLSGTVGRIQFDTPMAVAVALLLLLLAVLFGLARALGALLSLPGRFGRGGDRRVRREGDRAITAALTALAAGQAEDARREATRARRLVGDRTQLLLLSAEAERACGRGDAAERALRTLSEREDGGFLGVAGLARLATERGDHAGAALLVDRADRLRPGTPWARTERVALAARRGDWAEALRLARDDHERAAFATASAEAATDRAAAIKLARQAHRLAPGLAPAALAYARRLREEWDPARATEALRETWRVAQHPDLADAAVAAQPDRLQRVGLAEAFVAGTEGAFESRLFLGRTCLEAGMVGEARRHAAAACALPGADRRAPMLLSDVAEADPSLSPEARREASASQLRASVSFPPAPGWACASCGARPDRWAPICGQCGRAGRIDRSPAVQGGTAPGALAPPAAGMPVAGSAGSARP